MPWQFYLAILLSVAALVLAVLRIRAEHAADQESVYLYRPLTMLVIAMVAMVAPQPVSVFYKAAVVLALLLAILGEAVMMIKGTPLMIGVIFVSFIGLLYFFAFASQVTLQMPALWALLILLFAAIVYYFMARTLGEYWFPGVVFIVLLTMATWMALEAAVQTRQLWAWSALGGALALDAAAVILGVNLFRGGFRHSRDLMHGFYYLAQWLIAVSVWGTLLSLP